jgi:PhzF family phenazine biosynthesis protein
MKKSIQTYIVDSFTDIPFKGNPAGVCLLDQALSENEMQSIATELGLSETAFVIKESRISYAIRYFSPKMEIPLCGHATLASAKVILDQSSDISEIGFTTIEDVDLSVRKEGEVLEMIFPVYETEPIEVPQAMLDALGIDEIINSEFSKDTNIILIQIEDSTSLRGIQPDFVQLEKSYDNIDGVAVTALSKDTDYDFESRFFWPWCGTDEDPVTGATHTFLSLYWSKLLDKQKMRALQCSERSGYMDLELNGTNKLMIRSQAQIMLKGSFMI